MADNRKSVIWLIVEAGRRAYRIDMIDSFGVLLGTEYTPSRERAWDIAHQWSGDNWVLREETR